MPLHRGPAKRADGRPPRLDRRAKPPAFPLKTYRNPRTGEVTTVGQGINPGWTYHVGKAHFEGPAPRRAAGDDGPPPSLRPLRPVTLVAGQEGWTSFRWVQAPGGPEPVINRDQATAFANRMAAIFPGAAPAASFFGRVKGSSVEVTIRSAGHQIAMIRSFTARGGLKVVGHELLDLDLPLRRGGFAKAMLLTSFDFYLEVGMEAVEMEAGLHEGGYVWARLGFDAADPPAFRKAFEDGLARAVREGRVKPDHAATLLTVTRTLGNTPDLARITARLRVEGEDVGKQALLGTYWAARLNLTDAQAVNRVRSNARAR